MRPVLGPLPHPLLRAHHSLLHLLCPLQPLLLPLLSADEDACGSHSSRDDGSNDAPDDATCGPCACCVGCLCKKRDSVRESPGGSHSALFPAPPPKSPPTCLPLFPRAEDILFIHLILNDQITPQQGLAGTHVSTDSHNRILRGTLMRMSREHTVVWSKGKCPQSFPKKCLLVIRGWPVVRRESSVL